MSMFVSKKRFVGVVAVFVILISSILAFVFVFFVKTPSIQVSQSEINFGAIAAGTKATQTVEVQNTGSANLIIRNLQTGCGCTQVSLSQNKIAPDTSAQLHIVMDATEYGQKTFIYIFSNDRKHKITRLSVCAESTMQIMVEPTVIDFGQIADPGQLPVSKDVDIRFNNEFFSDTNSNGIVFETDNPYLQIDSSKTTVGNSKHVTLTLPANTPIGDISAELYIKSTSQRMAVRVIGQVRGDYFALPPMLLFNNISQQDPQIIQPIAIKMRRQKGQNEYIPNIESFELSSSLKELPSVSPSDDKNKILLTFNPSAPNLFWSPRTINGTIRFKCSGHDTVSKEVNVPIQVTLRVPKIKDK